ncbi:uncharacterized protein [Miscanthus floridulus]|uniref:uncharacterized protein n=1 Tax=Miscanthus floridulus TaxID=154761 RepID=UPI003457B1CE
MRPRGSTGACAPRPDAATREHQTRAVACGPSGAEVRAPAGSVRTVARRVCAGRRARVGPEGGGPSGGAEHASCREEQQAAAEHHAGGLHAYLACLRRMRLSLPNPSPVAAIAPAAAARARRPRRPRPTGCPWTILEHLWSTIRQTWRGDGVWHGGAAAGKKKGSVSDTFPIDCTCTKPAEDKIMEIAFLEKFRQERSKVAGARPVTFGESVTISR